MWSGTDSMGNWAVLIFGSGLSTLWRGSLFLAFVVLIGTGVHACQEPTGPSGAPGEPLTIRLCRLLEYAP